MQTFRFTFKLLATAILLFGIASVAHAQANRSWVSQTTAGDDANPCSRSAPCRTFAGALSKTAEGGEIDVLDPGGYGAVTINKAMTIDGGTGSGWASVLGAGDGITINIATSGINVPNSAVVILRHLTFNGISQASGPNGTNGIHLLRADRVVVENCAFQSFASHGINMELADTGYLWVHDCFFDKTTTGIEATTATGFVAVVNVDHCRFSAMSNGVKALVNSYVTIRDSYFGAMSGTTYGGVYAVTGATANVANSMFANDVIGVNIAGGTIRLSNNDFFGDVTAIAGGTAESANNNRFGGNTSDGATSNVITVK
jgi:hypothetical protein